MDLEFPNFSVLSMTFLLFFFMIVLVIGKSFKSNREALNLPPGPWKLPFIGNLHQLVGSLPHRRLRDLAKKYGPLMHLQLGQVSTVVVSSAEFAEEVMKTHDVIFASRPHILATKIMSYNSTDMVFAPYGEYWRRLRKICVTELLSTKRVQSFRSIREEEMSNLIDWIASKEGTLINLTEKVHWLIYSITSKAAFGKKFKDQEIFINITKEGTTLAAGFNIADLYPSIKAMEWISGIRPRLEKLHQKADRILENIINEHKNKMGKEKLGISSSEENEDLVDVLLKVHKHNDSEFCLTFNNIKAVIHDIFSAGSETSATVVDWAMSEMMKNPRIMRKAQVEVRKVFDKIGKVEETGIDELMFLKLVIKETLRLHLPAPLLVPRLCTERCKIKGFEIPINTKVVVNAWTIATDPKHWIEPDSFIPERFLHSSIDYKGNNFEYIPFGAGRRICPGISYGLANVELPLATLLYHFDWELPSGMKHECLDMSETFGLTVRRKDDLCLLPITYHPTPVPYAQNKQV